jgi:hypothetical protein
LESSRVTDLGAEEKLLPVLRARLVTSRTGFSLLDFGFRVDHKGDRLKPVLPGAPSNFHSRKQQAQGRDADGRVEMAGNGYVSEQAGLMGYEIRKS